MWLLYFFIIIFLIFFIHILMNQNKVIEGMDDTCSSDPVATSQKNAGNISLLDDRVTKLENQFVDFSMNLTTANQNIDILNQQMTAIAQSQTDSANQYNAALSTNIDTSAVDTSVIDTS